ncbi:MAG: hypothetical protein JWN48_1773 [Myxococcaceae bacterium]|nr:hypothetical protein [Myxococcaceae bacterium]
MSFGKNPHLPKAQAAEQKAADALDVPARVLAYREAAHQWERAAAKENPGKKRSEYEQNAAKNRELADEAAAGSGADEAGEVGPTEATPRRGLLN